MLGTTLRNWGFWASDFAQGSPIGKHCRDIEAQLTSGAPSPDRLEAMLRYAAQHVPFYASQQNFGSLQDFPVINKAVIKTDFEAFQSVVFQGQKLHIMRTSGSTGTPFAVRQDWDKRRRVLAEMIYFGQKAGYEVGDRFVFTRVWNKHNRKPWHVALRENVVMFDISSLDEARLESLRTLLLTDTDIRCMMGYPSTLGSLMKYMEHRGGAHDAFHLRTIISIAERLPRQDRESLRRQFGCTVVSRYSNQENGVLAQQCPDSGEFHLNTASYVFEFLKLDEDFPAEPGDRARMVVTDLYNRAMPMIRYDTGDVVVRQPAAHCGWATEALAEIEGRRLDFIYDTMDRAISPALLTGLFWPFTRLKQFQFRQEAKGQYQLVLNGAKGQYQDEEFLTLVKGFLGTDATISIVHVDQIPQLASGKFMAVTSRYRPPA